MFERRSVYHMNTLYLFDSELFSNFVELEEINMNYLDMVGNIRESFVKNLKKLKYLNLSHNKLNGTLPNIDEWKDIRNLEILELNNNSFVGDIPSIWPESFQHLTFLNLANNNFGDCY